MSIQPVHNGYVKRVSRELFVSMRNAFYLTLRNALFFASGFGEPIVMFIWCKIICNINNRCVTDEEILKGKKLVVRTRSSYAHIGYCDTKGHIRGAIFLCAADRL